MKIAIIGAGIMGASTAYACTKRGHEVTIFDQFKPCHTNGSSHGNSRIVRKAYPDPFYTEIMKEGYALWQQLRDTKNCPLLHETGLIYFGKRDSERLREVTESLRACGVEQTLMEPDSQDEVFLQRDEIGYFTKEAGWVSPKRAIQGILNSCRVSVRIRKVEDPCALANEFDRVLVCAGAWAKSLFTLPVTVTRQTFAYIQTPITVEGPVWINDSYPMFYGFPFDGGGGVKIGIHELGEPADPEEPGIPNPKHIEFIKTYARHRLKLVDPVVQSAHSCLYTRTANEDFLWGEFAPNVFWASPCSGHGFKFGPWIGERLADFAEGKMHPRDIPRFNLS
jgi:glycine/D-amino acid oxidase-like deaminating enzyme